MGVYLMAFHMFERVYPAALSFSLAQAINYWVVV